MKITNAGRKSAAVMAAIAIVALGGQAHAIDNGGGTGGTTPPIECKTGMVYDADKKICVQAEAGVLDDEQLYEQGRVLALAGRYGEALTALGAVVDKDDAMVLTMIGFAKRKSGALAEGIALYHQALAFEPDNLNTLEYLGEGYVASGEMGLAVTQLHKLKTLCGPDCDQYQQLATVISGGANWQ